MRKVQNGRCIANISKKSILANKKRNSILLAAIILTTVMLSTLFTVASSLIKSLETATCYQVGTYTHAGFKYLTQEEYDKLKNYLKTIRRSDTRSLFAQSRAILIRRQERCLKNMRKWQPVPRFWMRLAFRMSLDRPCICS